MRREAVAQHEGEHEKDKYIKVREILRIGLVVVHVSDGIDVYEKAHPRDDERHYARERIEQELEAYGKATRGNPFEKVLYYLPPLGLH